MNENSRDSNVGSWQTKKQQKVKYQDIPPNNHITWFMWKEISQLTMNISHGGRFSVWLQQERVQLQLVWRRVVKKERFFPLPSWAQELAL